MKTVWEEVDILAGKVIGTAGREKYLVAFIPSLRDHSYVLVRMFDGVVIGFKDGQGLTRKELAQKLNEWEATSE